MAGIEPVINVGRQSALYLAILIVLAGGVGLFAARNELAAVSQAAMAGADTPQPQSLDGSFLLQPALGAMDQDPPRDHIAFYVTGSAAEAMFTALPMAPQSDQCVGRLAKFGNGLICHGLNNDGSPADPAYSCTFAIDLKNQSLALAEDC